MCAQVTCRPGGDACKGLNLWDYQTFAGKERLHGLKYQGAVMPNGIVLVWGPWRGTEHDAGNLYESRLLDMLREAAEELGRDFTVFGDSAYPLHRFCQHILKPAANQSLTRLQRRYNALMARFRIVIEQVFAETSKYWACLTHHHNLRLGSQQVGKMFPLGVFFLNLHSLLYGNQTAAYYEADRILLEMSIEDYISLANDE
jgi:hypothetical protein